MVPQLAGAKAILPASLFRGPEGPRFHLSAGGTATPSCGLGIDLAYPRMQEPELQTAKLPTRKSLAARRYKGKSRAQASFGVAQDECLHHKRIFLAD